ncbi:TLC domain-containing protein [Powellomyces hirtus]|nr:TLC domain-containing protein [Powellomyces hirtus]
MAADSPPLAFQPAGLYPQVSLPNVLLRLLNYNPEKGTCTKSWNDVTVAILIAACYVLLRNYLYKHVFPILADRWHVPRSPGARSKFAEQTWLLICHSSTFIVGAILMIGKPYASCLWGKREGYHYFWIGYPQTHRELDPVFKLFYLTILGYWLHHCYELVTEGLNRRAFERAKAQGQTNIPYAHNRSDFWALALHHAVTVSLVVVSYFMNWTKGGHVVIVLLDVADIFLPLAKILKYAGHSTICDITFAIFTLSWIVTRHWLLLLVCVTIYSDSLVYIPEGSRHWDPWGEGCFYSMKVYWLFLGFFGTLQVLLIYWLAMIVKVVVKVVRGGAAEDIRSDDEDDEDFVLEDNVKQKKPRAPKALGMGQSESKKSASARPKAKRTGSGVELRSGHWDTVKEGELRRRH